MPGGTVRSALIVAMADGRTAAPQPAAREAMELARLLGDPEVGGFEVSAMTAPRGDALRLELIRFLADRAPHDTVLVHLTGHVAIDAAGDAYLCGAADHPGASGGDALPLAFIEAELARCRSERLVVLLDCSSDQPAVSWPSGSAGGVRGLRERFEGSGRSVHLVSTATVIDVLRRRPAAREPADGPGLDRAVLLRAPGPDRARPTRRSLAMWAALTAVALVASVVAVAALGPPGVALSAVALAAASWPLLWRAVGAWRRLPADAVVLGEGVPFHRLYMLRRSQKSTDYFRHHGPGR
jgi:hypothetical protein